MEIPNTWQAISVANVHGLATLLPFLTLHLEWPNYGSKLLRLENQNRKIYKTGSMDHFE